MEIISRPTHVGEVKVPRSVICYATNGSPAKASHPTGPMVCGGQVPERPWEGRHNPLAHPSYFQ